MTAPISPSHHGSAPQQGVLTTPQYAPQPHIAYWLSSNERFQVPKNPATFLQQMRDGTLIWRLLTVHLAEPPMPSESITERWRQIASALLDCGVELTPHGLKLLLLGDADVLDKMLSVVYSLHHAGGQGTSAVASLVTPCVVEPEVLYPRLFHSALVNAKQSNFVERVKTLTGGCCTPETTDVEREFFQLEALSSHSRRLVEYGMAEAFFRLGLELMWRQRNTSLGLKVAALMKTFVLEVGPESSFKSLVGPKGVQHALRGWHMPLVDVDDYDDADGTGRTSAEMMENVSQLLRSSDTQPELQDFLRMLLINICSVPSEPKPSAGLAAKQPISPTSAGRPKPQQPDAPILVDESRLVYLLRRIFNPSAVGHRVFLEQMWAFVTRATDRAVVRAIALWLTEASVAIMEGREPGQESYGRFNPTARFEEGFHEPSLGAGAGAVGSALVSARGRSSTTSTVSPRPVGNAARDDEVAKPNTAALATAMRMMPRDDEDEDGEDTARQAKRMAEVRLKLQKQQGQERREREICALGLRLNLRLWSEFTDLSASSDLVYDVMEFLKTARGMEMLCTRPDLLAELACAMFCHQSFYHLVIELLEQHRTVAQTPELRRLLLQNLCDYHNRPYPQQNVDDATEPAHRDGPTSPFGADSVGARSVSPTGSTATNAGPMPKASRTVQLLELLSTINELYPQIPALGAIEGDLLMTVANGIITNLQMQGPATAPPTTAGASTPRNAPPLAQLRSGGGAAAFTSTTASSVFEDTQSYGGGGGGGNGDAAQTVTLRTVRQFLDILVSLFDQDPFFHRCCVQVCAKLSHFYLSLPSMDPGRTEYLSMCLSTLVNDLLAVAERHPYTDLILQAIGQYFLEHPLDGRRAIAECVHMFFQILVRRDFSERSPEEAAASEAFGKRMRKLCELMGMPTTRVKVKVLDDEEAARHAAQRRLEEEERKRIAAEEAERVRQETEDREELIAMESGKERRKKYVRQPLYVAPEPVVRPGDVPTGASIFEHKRNIHWIKQHVVLGTLMDHVLVGISRVDYNKQCGASKRVGSVNTSSNGGGMPESFWSGWQRGKTYEQQQQERRKEEEAEIQRREILRKIRDQEVKEKLRTEAFNADVKKLNQLLHTEQQHVLEEEQDRRSLVFNIYLKGFVALYHLFREEHEHFVSSKESVSRRRAEDAKRRHEEERNRAKEKINKYWEEKEFLELQLQQHRQEKAREEAEKQEAKKRSYLDEQKRKLMTWRLEHQYEAGCEGRDGMLLDCGGVSTTSTTMSDGPGRPRPSALLAKHGKQGSLSLKKGPAGPQRSLQPDASSPDLSADARAGSKAKLAPLAEAKHRRESLGEEAQHRPRRRSSEPIANLDGVQVPDDGSPEAARCASEIHGGSCSDPPGEE